jgi:hypothetical protein
MVRIVGILCGSALAISSLIIALGVPEFLPEPEASPDATAAPNEIETTPAPEPEATAVVETSIVDSTEPEIALAAEVVLASTVEAEALPEQLPEPLPAAPTEQSTEHWYAFWSPFRSELAANGFVSQLQRNTGMDYRVVQLKPGVYEVAFAYEADADIATHLAAISAATGLDMPDG